MKPKNCKHLLSQVRLCPELLYFPSTSLFFSQMYSFWKYILKPKSGNIRSVRTGSLPKYFSSQVSRSCSRKCTSSRKSFFADHNRPSAEKSIAFQELSMGFFLSTEFDYSQQRLPSFKRRCVQAQKLPASTELEDHPSPNLKNKNTYILKSQIFSFVLRYITLSLHTKFI